MNPVSTKPKEGFKMPEPAPDPPHNFHPILASDVVSRVPEWVWFPYIPKGMVTILEGEPDQGKSWITCSIAAHISNGTPLPGQTHPSPPQKVLMMTQEDDLGFTMRPRLEKLGANLSNIYLMDGYVTVSEDSLARLDEFMRSMFITIVVMDPMTKYMGGKIDINRANETDMMMGPLVRAARDTECAILLVRHLRKSKGANAKDNGIGSINIIGSARSVLQVSENADGEKIMTHIKHNISAEGPSIRYSTEDNDFKWGEMIGSVKRKVSTKPRSSLEQARAFIRTTLRDGPVDSRELMARAKDEGISMVTLDRAKVGLAVSQKDGQKWVWRLEEDEQAQGDQEAGAECGGVGESCPEIPEASEGHIEEHSTEDEEGGSPASTSGNPLSPELQALLDTMNAKLSQNQRLVS